MKSFLSGKSLFSVLFFSLLLLLAACANEEGSNENTNTDDNEDGGGDTITAWAWDPNFNIAALELAKEHYEGDAEVDIVENAQDDIVQKLNTGLSSGTMNGMPNIVLIEDYRAQSFLQAYPDAFFELTDYFNQEDFAEYKLAPTSIEDRQYGLPFDTGVTGLYLRTDYLEEAGLTEEDFQDITWDQFIEYGKQIKEATGKNMLTVDPNNMEQLRMMSQSADSWYLEEDGSTPNIEGNEALKAAFEAYKKLIEADIVQNTSDWSQFVGAFNSGDVASIFTGNWITPSVMAEESQEGKWTVVPIPKLSTEGATHYSSLGGSSFYVLNVAGKEKAAEFLQETFGSNDALYKDLVTEVGALGTYLPVIDSEAYQQENEFFQGKKLTANFAQWMDQIPAVNYGMHTYAIDDILVVEMQEYLNGKDIEAVLQDAQANAESQIK